MEDIFNIFFLISKALIINLRIVSILINLTKLTIHQTIFKIFDSSNLYERVYYSNNNHSRFNANKKQESPRSKEREREKNISSSIKFPSHQKIQRDPCSTLSSKLVSTQSIPKITRSKKKQDINPLSLSLFLARQKHPFLSPLPLSLSTRPKILASISNRVTLSHS